MANCFAIEMKLMGLCASCRRRRRTGIIAAAAQRERECGLIGTYNSLEGRALLREFELGNKAWPLVSSYNYTSPDANVLNVAFPSAVSVYYTMLLRPGKTYRLAGAWPAEDLCFESSLELYTLDGQILGGGKSSWNMFDDDPLVVVVTDEPLWAMLRFYVNRKLNGTVKLENYLWRVDDECGPIPMQDSVVRVRVSQELQTFARAIFARISAYNPCQTAFYYTMDTTGLFPSATHYYLAARPGPDTSVRGLKISGLFPTDQPKMRYVDITAVNQSTIAIEGGIPFNEFSGLEYIVYVTDPDYEPKNMEIGARHITWTEASGGLRQVLYRLIDYETRGIAAVTQSLDPEEVRALLGKNYPRVEYL